MKKFGWWLVLGLSGMVAILFVFSFFQPFYTFTHANIRGVNGKITLVIDREETNDEDIRGFKLNGFAWQGWWSHLSSPFLFANKGNRGYRVYDLPLIYPLLGALWILRRRWRWSVELHNRMRLGQCLACGYDCLGTISGICPECGTKLPLLSSPQS